MRSLVAQLFKKYRPYVSLSKFLLDTLMKNAMATIINTVTFEHFFLWRIRVVIKGKVVPVLN